MAPLLPLGSAEAEEAGLKALTEGPCLSVGSSNSVVTVLADDQPCDLDLGPVPI